MAVKIGWFSTGRDKAARDLLSSVVGGIERGELDVEIRFVFSNRERGENRESDKFFSLVEGFSIPLVCFSSKKFKPEQRRAGLEESKKLGRDSDNLIEWRRSYDSVVLDLIGRFDVDICVLAGYMLIVSDLMCEKLDMINLHPAPPGGPTGSWEEVIWELIRTRAKETGAMVHLVTPELDRGPAITWFTHPIRTEEFSELWEKLEEDLEKKGFEQIKKEYYRTYPLFRRIREVEAERELPLLLLTLKAFGEGTIKIVDKKVYLRGEVCANGYQLSREVEEYLAAKLEREEAT